MTSTDIPIPPAVVEAAARACYEYWRDKDTTGTLPPWEAERFLPFRDGWKEQATAALCAGLAAWPGMYTDDETMYGKVIGKTIFLPITENSNDKA